MTEFLATIVVQHTFCTGEKPYQLDVCEARSSGPCDAKALDLLTDTLTHGSHLRVVAA